MGKSYLALLKKSIHDLVRNPLIFLAPIILIAFLILFPILSNHVKDYLSTTLANVLWLILFYILFISFLSFTSAGIIGLSKEIHSKAPPRIFTFFSSGLKFFLPNFVIFFCYMVLYALVNAIAFYGVSSLGWAFNLSLNSALAVYILVYFVLILGVISLFLFSNFYLVLFNKGIFSSIRMSVLLVRKELPLVISLGILFFIIGFVSSSLGDFASTIFESILTLLLLPGVILFITRLVLSREK